MTTRARPSDPDTVALWHAVPWLEELDADTVAALAEVATVRSYPAGTFIFAEGEPCAGLFLVHSGRVKISRFSREGREHILHLMQRGDTFNDVSALDGGPNPATAIAHTDCVLLRIARPDLRALAGQHASLAWALIESIARRARHLVSSVQDLAMRNVRGRLARLLLEQAEALERGDMPVSLTQEEMASRLGTVREVVGRTLRSLAADGVIAFERNRIVVLDRSHLEEEAEI
jgi:CRP/FNR family transcriptional regulator